MAHLKEGILTFLKKTTMVLRSETKVGLTFGQILSLIGVFGAILLAWVTINVRIAQAEVRIETLEKGRLQNAENIERIRSENREDHQKIMEKLDRLYLKD
jgi:predicted sulfurtransferase